jgi:hypothetical protein
MSKKKKKQSAPSSPKVKKKKSIVFPDFALDKNYLILSAILAIVLAFAQYVQTLPYEFVLDDIIVISENSFVKKGVSGIPELMHTESMVGYFGEQKDLIPGARYRPLSLVTFAIEYEIFGGLNPRMNHLVNIILYALCGFLIFMFFGKILKSNKKLWLSVPILAGLIWLLHPVHSEAVANIKGRDEIMSLLFSLGCILLSLSIFNKDKGTIFKYIGLFICFILGLLSKENTITLLAIIPATLYFFRPPNMKKMLTLMGVLLLSFILYIVIRADAIGGLVPVGESQDIMNNPFLGMGFMERMATILFVLLKYVGLSFVPYPLTHDYYPFQIPRVGWGNIFVLLSLVIHVGMAVFAILKFRSRNIWAYIIFFYIASLSIYSNIVINVGTTMNERFLFVPTVATCLALILGLTQILKKFNLPKIVLPIIIGLISIIYFGISFQRAQVWENALTLNRAAVKVSTNSARANSFMATALFEEAKTISDRNQKKALLDEATIYVNRSYNLLPTYTNVNIMKAGIAAEHYKLDGDLDALLRTFTEIAPNKPSLSFMHEYIEYLDGRDDDKMMDFFYNVGYEVLALQNNKYDWGLKFLNYGLIKEPNNAKINWAISQVYGRAGNMKQANAFRNKAIQLDPSYMNK